MGNMTGNTVLTAAGFLQGRQPQLSSFSRGIIERTFHYTLMDSRFTALKSPRRPICRLLTAV